MCNQESLPPPASLRNFHAQCFSTFFWHFLISVPISFPCLKETRIYSYTELCLSWRSLKPISGVQELRLVPNLIWNPILFTPFRNLDPKLHHSQCIPAGCRLLSVELQVWRLHLCRWHQPGVAAVLHWVRLNLNIEETLSGSAVVLHSVHAIMWDRQAYH